MQTMMPICKDNIDNFTAIVIATHNKGKTSEIRGLLKNFPVSIRDLDDFQHIPGVEENGETFAENAYKKASVTASRLRMPAIADDSGLLVQALGGAPGVYSARYAGENAADEQRCNKLLNEMKGKTDRRAVFQCVISIAVPTGAALRYEARCEGLISIEPSGTNGFGYDSVFYYPPLKKTFAELTMEEKSAVSHRGRALRAVQNECDKVLLWIRENMPVEG